MGKEKEKLDSTNKTETKLNIEKEKTKFERHKKGVFEVIGIQVITDKESELVTQIRFKQEDDIDLTWKPKAREEEKEKHKGLEVLKRSSRSITMDEIPKKLYELNKLLNEHGAVRIMTDYTVMNTKDRDDEDISYKFIYNNDFDNLYPIDNENIEIPIKE